MSQLFSDKDTHGIPVIACIPHQMKVVRVQSHTFEIGLLLLSG